MRLRPEIAQQILDIANGVPTRVEMMRTAVALACQWWGIAAKGMCERMATTQKPSEAKPESS